MASPQPTLQLLQHQQKCEHVIDSKAVIAPRMTLLVSFQHFPRELDGVRMKNNKGRLVVESFLLSSSSWLTVSEPIQYNYVTQMVGGGGRHGPPLPPPPFLCLCIVHQLFQLLNHEPIVASTLSVNNTSLKVLCAWSTISCLSLQSVNIIMTTILLRGYFHLTDISIAGYCYFCFFTCK